MSPLDKQYLKFGEAFETRFLNQGEYENRSIETTLELGWDVLSMLPRDELHRVSDALLEQHYREKSGSRARRDRRPRPPERRSVMAKLNIAPTKSNLLGLKRQLAFAEEGYDLLEQKRQILIFELMSRLNRARDAEMKIAEAFRRAFAALREATLDIGSEALDRAALGVSMDHQITLADQHLMGMKIPRVTVKTEPASVQFGVGGTSANTDVAMRRFVEVLPLAGRVGGTGKRRVASGARTSQDPAPLQCPVENFHPRLPGNDRLYHRRAWKNASASRSSF